MLPSDSDPLNSDTVNYFHFFLNNVLIFKVDYKNIISSGFSELTLSKCPKFCVFKN